MGTTFNDRNQSQRIREPLFQVTRTKYKSSRSSEKENVETNLLRLDINRILSELDNIDYKIDLDIINLVGLVEDLDTTAKLNDGISSIIEGVNFYQENITQLDYSLSIDTIDKVSSKLFRLSNKLSRLENGN